MGIGDLDILPRTTSANAPSLRDALIVAAVAALLIQGQELYIVRSGAGG